jgi:hypothetical protein
MNSNEHGDMKWKRGKHTKKSPKPKHEVVDEGINLQK